jgi:tRNA1Val (adenine37-N6)-methyltransferase
MGVTLDSIRDIQLYQSKAGYRFSVDALLLFDFIHLKHVSTIADLGAGSGIVGILLAKKYPKAKVTLIEIQPSLCELAERNVILNNVGKRVHVSQSDFRKIPENLLGKFDLIVSNPPFRRLKTGRLNIAEERSIARHEITMNLDALIKTASSLLREKGRFCTIYHPWRIAELFMNVHEQGFEPKRLRLVH